MLKRQDIKNCTLYFLFALLLSCSESGPLEQLPITEPEGEVIVGGGETDVDEPGENEGQESIPGEQVDDEPTEGENQQPNEDETVDDNILAVIQLSGDEAVIMGDSLIVGHIAVGRGDLTGTTKSVILTDVNTPITDEGPAPESLEKGFVLIGGDDLPGSADGGAEKDISMVIFIDSVEYRFGCGVPPSGNFINCGLDYNIDFDKKEIVFDSTTVNNTETQAVLILDGIVNW